MPKKAETRPERVIALIAGESGSGKSFFVANLKNALIFDTDIGGGLSYAQARIERNQSERVQCGSYLDVIDELQHRRQNGSLKKITTLAIDHLTTLQQEAVLRYNPQFQENTFGREHDRANKEWRKVRDFVHFGDFNLVCTAHMKNKYEKKAIVGIVADASKNIEADFSQVLFLQKNPALPSTAITYKWRRDPEDSRGQVPGEFPLTLDAFLKIHGSTMEGERHEVVMADAKQVEKILWLLSVVKGMEEWAEKALSKAKADSWAETPASIIAACIAHLEGVIERRGETVVREKDNGLQAQAEKVF